MNGQSRFNLIWVLLFLVWQLPFTAAALEQWYLPVENQLKTLKVENPSNRTQDLWISGPIDQPRSEPEVWYEIPAKSQVEIPLNEFQEFSWVHLKSNDHSPIRLSVKDKKETVLVVQKGNSDHWQKKVTQKINQLFILNTSAVDQEVKVNEKKYFLKAFEKKKLNVNSLSALDIRGQHKLTVLGKQNSRWQYLSESLISNELELASDSRWAYFLFTDSLNQQSFVVKTDNAEIKDQARNQIADSRKYPKKILVAQIALGHGNNNRDFFHNNKSPWSWQVTQAITFADYASQECDGSPAFVDEFARTWVVSPGAICFWGYKVSKELTEKQIRLGQD